MMRSLHDTTESHVTLPLAAHDATTTTDGAAVDLADADAAEFEVVVGTWTDEDHGVAFYHREKPADSWVAIPLADLDARVAADLEDDGSGNGVVNITDDTRDDTVVQVGYIGGKRYVKAETTVSTDVAGSGAVYGVLVKLARLRFTGKNPMTPGWPS